MSLQGHYQNAYITHDLERAVDLIGPGFGVSAFTTFDVEMTARTPQGDKSSQLRVGIGWAGKLQIELIQPVGGFVAPYLSALPSNPKDFVPRLHHVAVRRDTVAAMRKEAEALGLPIAFESEGAGLHCIFVDARERLGHYFELVSATPAGWAMVGWPDDERRA